MAKTRSGSSARGTRAAKNARRIPDRQIDFSDIPVWYLMAKDEGHGFAKKRNADFQFYATVLFMKECLLK
jgi:hypothetical protein